MIGRLTISLLKGYRGLRYGEPLEPDETVVLFPQSAAQLRAGVWRVPLHAWVVELEEGSISRKLGQIGMLSALDLLDVVEDQPNTDTFRERLNWFMADREMNKRLRISIGDQHYTSPRSRPNGHIRFSVDYHTEQEAGDVIQYHTGSNTIGHAQLVGSTGLSVISDIDDTIKISNVIDKKQLIKGFFFDDYHVVDGMPELYRQLYECGVCFHYVSASPWQLYPSLAPLLKSYYPFGSLSQRHFYIGDQSFWRFFKSSKAYKLKALTDIIARFPARRYLLVGDSGERDPEVYAEIATLYPAQIAGILIRRLPSTDQPANATVSDHGVPVYYFDHPQEITSFAMQIAETATVSGGCTVA